MAVDITIDEKLLEEKPSIIVQEVKGNLISAAIDTRADAGRSKTPGNAKNIDEFTDLVMNVIENSEATENTSEDNKIIFSRDYTPEYIDKEAVTFKITTREPGRMDQGAPLEGKVKNLRPLFREEAEDPDNPGYKILVFGYWYDNVVEFTCWARTHKVVDQRAIWFENLMQSYLWFFRYSGVNRVLYLGRGSEIAKDIEGNTIFGRSLRFFVRTEEITKVHEKAIERISLNYGIITN